MIYITEFIIIFFSFYLSYLINLRLKNFDQPGKDKIHKTKVLTSGGLIPFFFLSLILFFLQILPSYLNALKLLKL